MGSDGEGRARHGPGPVGLGSPTGDTLADTAPTKDDVVSRVTPDRRALAEQLHHMAIMYAEAAGLQAKLRVQAWRDGYAAGIADIQRDYERGYADALASVKDAQQGIRRSWSKTTSWNVRGQQRTRETFGQPHPRDFRGRGAT